MRRRSSSFATAIFGDTSAFFALAARMDQHHAEAEALLDGATVEQRRLYTTNFVLAETHALLLHRLRRNRGEPFARTTALRAVQHLYQSAEETGTLVRVTAADEVRAFEILARYSDKNFTFTDATSFAVMERLGLFLAFTFDNDFAQAGFTRFR